MNQVPCSLQCKVVLNNKERLKLTHYLQKSNTGTHYQMRSVLHHTSPTHAKKAQVSKSKVLK